VSKKRSLYELEGVILTSILLIFFSSLAVVFSPSFVVVSEQEKRIARNGKARIDFFSF
jgi:hypothetical protein